VLNVQVGFSRCTGAKTETMFILISALAPVSLAQIASSTILDEIKDQGVKITKILTLLHFGNVQPF